MISITSIFLGPNIPFSHHIVEHSHSVIFIQREGPSFALIQNNRQSCTLYATRTFGNHEVFWRAAATRGAFCTDAEVRQQINSVLGSVMGQDNLDGRKCNRPGQCRR
jgi:hypothetical protein